jgi:beta-phosphoglucomutase-like phosphatase (HAD superfamily)
MPVIENLQTIFFDLDGVVVDSEPLHAKAKRIVLEKYGIHYLSTVFDDYKGKSDKLFFEYVAGNLDTENHLPDMLVNDKNAVFEKIIKEMKLIDGFLFFHEKAKRKNIKTMLVSSTSQYSLSLLDSVYHLTQLFDFVITEQDTEHHKPHPAPYLKALSILPSHTMNTIVIEDSPNGILSAKGAGCFVYGITSSFSEDILRNAGADDIVAGYKDLERKLGW